MEIGVFGINHNMAPIEIREKFNFTESKKIQASNKLLDLGLEEVVILSTCNRSEVYFVHSNSHEAIDLLLNFYKDFFNFQNVEDYSFFYQGQEAVEHLFMVAGGLDSLVLGEDQILGQVKEALDFSLKLKFSKKILNRLFMSSLSLGKKIRSRLKISEIPLSTSYIGIELLREKLDGFQDKKALLIGLGEIGQLALKYLYTSSLDRIYVTNRSDGRLKDIIFSYPDLELIEYGERYDYIDKVDCVISASGAPHKIIEKKDMPRIDRSLYILDLAMPRDVDEAIGEEENIEIIHLDNLELMSEENKTKREELAKEALDLIKEDIDDYLLWLETIEVDPILGSLQEKIDLIQKDSMDYLNRKLDLRGRDEKIINELIGYALGRITREAVLNLKDPSKARDKEYQKIISDIFDLEV